MSQIASLVAQTAIALGVDPNLAMAVASAESGFSQSAVSSAGAIGVMQLMPGTAAGMGVNPNDVAQNIQGGVRYLAQMLATFGGDAAAALAAYNWGPGNVQNAQATYGSAWFSAIPSSVQAYVTRILGAVGSAPPASVVPDGGSGQPQPSDYATAPSSGSGLPGWLVPAGLAAAGVGLLAALDVL